MNRTLRTVAVLATLVSSLPALAQVQSITKVAEQGTAGLNGVTAVGVSTGPSASVGFREAITPERVLKGSLNGSFSTFLTQGQVAAPLTETLTSLGQMDFVGTLAFAATDNTGKDGLYTKTKPVSRLARATDPAPDGGSYVDLGPVRIGRDDAVAFFGNTDLHFSPAESSFGGLFGKTSTGPVALLAAKGQVVSGFTLQRFANVTTHLSTAGGTVGFIADITPDSSQRAVFLVPVAGGSSQVYAFPGQANPADGVFTSFDEVAVSALGDVAFLGSSSPGGQGIYLNFNKVAGLGLAINGSDFNYFVSRVSLNSSKTVVFHALVSSLPTKLGIYYVKSGSAQIKHVIRKGDALFGSTVTALSVPDTSLNEQNQVVFTYTLANGKRGVALAQL